MPEEELLTVVEVAKILRVDPATVRRWLAQGAVPFIELPHQGSYTNRRVRRSDLNKILGK